MKNRNDRLLLKSKLQQPFVQRINTNNYNSLYTNKKCKHQLRKYTGYLTNTNKNCNWIELQHLRTHTYNCIPERRMLKIVTSNRNNVLNIGVFYKQEQIATYREIVLKLKQHKYGVYTTKHDGFNKLGKDLFLRLICINYLFPFEIFLLSHINRSFYQLLHSDYTIITKYLINREYKTKYYWKAIANMIETLQRDSFLSQNIIDRVDNRFNFEERVSMDKVFKFWEHVLEFLECFENVTDCTNKAKMDCVKTSFWDYYILSVVSQHDHVEECLSSDNCDCIQLTAHPHLNILNIIGKMCIFWILTSQSKQYHSLNCHTEYLNFEIFRETISADKLITSLAMNYKCDDHNQLLFSHNIDTIDFGTVKFILTPSQMYQMYSKNKKSFLIEYRVCDNQFIKYFNKFKYNATQYNCFAKLSSNINQHNLIDNKIRDVIFLHINKAFEYYRKYLAFDHLSHGDHDETFTHVDEIMAWLYEIGASSVETTKSVWEDETVKVILFAINNHNDLSTLCKDID